MQPRIPIRFRLLLAASILTFAFSPGASAQAGRAFTIADSNRLRYVRDVKISPDGSHIAYTLSVYPDPLTEKDGPARSELHVVDTEGHSRPYVTDDAGVRGIDWTPDGRAVSFLAKRDGDEHRSLYLIPLDGGEARRVLACETRIDSYDWHPSGARVAFIAGEQEPRQQREQEKKGFDAEVYEEDWRPARLWIAAVDAARVEQAPTTSAASLESSPGGSDQRMLDLSGSVISARWSPDGRRLLVSTAPTPLIDDEYMRQTYAVIDAQTGAALARIETVGKVGQARWAPDGRHIALLTAADLNDPQEGRLTFVSADGGKPRDLLPDLEGHIEDFAWQDADTLMYKASEGVWTRFAKIDVDGGNPKSLVPTGGAILNAFDLADDGMAAAFVADTPRHPNEVYFMQHGDAGPRRLTHSNPWLEDVRLARQEAIEYEARDGLKLDAVLIYPLDYQEGQRYPLIIGVHGGPEGHFSNGWITRYVDPGQAAAARGYAVAYPNYRGSTGRGVAFSKLGQADYGGGEFNDLVDLADHLVRAGLVDEKKVGVTGGSYGGFAAAWCATALTEHFAAAVAYMGVTDQTSKFGTTDIPNEMYLVHARKWPWEDWDFFRERSPIHYAQQSRTPLLIIHGKADTRVHPSQSLELYRYMKTLGKTVRLVLYPGEPHGHRRAASRHDHLVRTMRWFDHYLKGPGGDPPAWEVDYEFSSEAESKGRDGEGY